MRFLSNRIPAQETPSVQVDEIVARLIRMESRLCQLMIHQGMKPYEKAHNKQTPGKSS